MAVDLSIDFAILWSMFPLTDPERATKNDEQADAHGGAEYPKIGRLTFHNSCARAAFRRTKPCASSGGNGYSPKTHRRGRSEGGQKRACHGAGHGTDKVVLNA